MGMFLWQTQPSLEGQPQLQERFEHPSKGVSTYLQIQQSNTRPSKSTRNYSHTDGQLNGECKCCRDHLEGCDISNEEGCCEILKLCSRLSNVRV
jgi:hypothetical protein